MPLNPQLFTPKTSLYIHFPWCEQKCPYCDFNSHALKDPLPESDYINALILDLKAQKETFQQVPMIHSIFMGGGTPSLFSAASLEYLLSEVGKLFPLESDIEITMEANPGTLHDQKLVEFRLAGINRLSLGVQSFQDHHLKRLGRIHSAAGAKMAIEAALSAGFQRINLDLMHGLPDQSLDEAISDLQTALAYQTGHLSWYQLTLEPNTAFFHEKPELPNEMTLGAIETAGLKCIEAVGLKRYEISAYGAPGQASRHNLNYWRFGDYIGIGAGAHGKQTHPEQSEIIRYSKFKHPKQYLKSPTQMDTAQPISRDLYLFEYLMNTCRLFEPISISSLETHLGLKLPSIQKKIDTAHQMGLLNQGSEMLVVTEKGHQFLNSLLQIFL